MIPFTPPEPLERDVKRTVMGLCRQVGCDVFNLDQGFRPGGPRHGSTRQTEGLGDLYLLHDAFGSAWVEVKRPTGGVQTIEQQAFEARCRRRGVHYILGGEYELLVFLHGVGLWPLPAGLTFAQFATPTVVHQETPAEAEKRHARRRGSRGSAPARSRHLAFQTSGPEA